MFTVCNILDMEVEARVVNLNILEFSIIAVVFNLRLWRRRGDIGLLLLYFHENVGFGFSAALDYDLHHEIEE